MSQLFLRYGVLSSIPLLSLVLSVAGCGPSVPPQGAKAASGGASATTEGGGAARAPQAQPTSADNEVDPSVRENLAKLSPEDRALAEKQKTCPVSDAPLGSMGVPYKVTVKGRTVFLCCEGCEGGLKKEPDKYVAKLNRAEGK